MISNTCYELINTSCDLLSYWKRYLGTTDSPVLEYVCPRFEYAENLKDYYRYVAWAEDYNQSEENYWCNSKSQTLSLITTLIVT